MALLLHSPQPAHQAALCWQPTGLVHLALAMYVCCTYVMQCINLMLYILSPNYLKKKCIFAAKFYWMKHGVWNGDCPGFGFYVSQLTFCKDMRQKQFSPQVT